MNNFQNRDPRALRGLGQADFDYTDRSTLATQPGIEPYVLLHTHAEARIAAAGGTVQTELAIRDSAIDFLCDQLEEIGAAALTITTITRLTSEMRKADDDAARKKGIAELFDQLEALVGG